MSSMHQQSENNDWHKVAALILGSDKVPELIGTEFEKAAVYKIGLEDMHIRAVGDTVGLIANDTCRSSVEVGSLLVDEHSVSKIVTSFVCINEELDVAARSSILCNVFFRIFYRLLDAA